MLYIIDTYKYLLYNLTSVYVIRNVNRTYMKKRVFLIKGLPN